jgi:hypothetical protein
MDFLLLIEELRLELEKEKQYSRSAMEKLIEAGERIGKLKKERRENESVRFVVVHICLHTWN